MNEPITSVKALTKIPFKNVDAQAIPPFAVMRVSGSIVEDGVAFLACEQVGSELATEFAVNGPVQVAAGSKGVCYREGDLRVAFDGGSPQPGECWGVRADQWTLSRGYPSIFTVHAVRDAANHILHGRIAPLAEVLGAPAAELSPMANGEPGSGAVAVYVWDGDQLAPAEPAMTLVGHNISTTPIKAGMLTQFTRANGIWVAAASELLVRFELTADLVYGVEPGGNNARVLVYSAGAYVPTGQTIRVYDWTALGSGAGAYATWSGKGPVTSPARNGYQGWAIRQPDSGRYEIVWMESQARTISFRLYARLSTADASQANCSVLTYWDGRDPDPAASGATVYNLPTDNAGVYKFFGEANAVGYAVWNERLARYEISAIEGDGRHWVLFKNTSGYAAPANAILTDLGVTAISGGHTNSRQVMTVGQPSTTLSRSYWVNGYADVANGAVGVCCSTESPVEALYDTAGAAHGESWGPKPGQWTLAKGFPGFTIVGVTDPTAKIALVRQDPIVQLLGKTNDVVANNSSTTNYKIYTGLPGSEADSGFAAPSAYNRSGSIGNGAWCWLRWKNTSWELSSFANRIVHVTLSSAIAAGATGSVTLPDGRSVTAKNWSAVPFSSGDKATAYEDLSDGNFYLIESGGSSGTMLFKGTLGANLASAATSVSVGSLSSYTATAAPGGSVTASNILGLAGSSGDVCVVIQNNASGSPTYDLLAVQHHVYTIVTDVAFDGTSEKQTKRDFAAMANAGAASPATIWTGSECS